MQHGTVADPEASSGIWRIEDRPNLFQREMLNQPLVITFTRDGMDLPCLCQSRGYAEFNLSNERLDCGESSVACCRTVAALFLDVSEKGENQRRIPTIPLW